MKKILLPILAIGAMLGIYSCTSDELLVGNGNANGEDGDGRYAYINATISLPSAGSRSATDTVGGSNSNGSTNTGNPDTDAKDDSGNDAPGVLGPDVEYGYDYENDVRQMILLIADKDDNYLTHLVVTGMAAASTTGGSYTFNTQARIPYGVLDEAYDKDKGGLFATLAGVQPNMHLYAFCNFTQSLLTQLNDYQAAVAEVPAKDRTDESKTYTPKGQTVALPLLTAWRDFQGEVVEKASMANQTPMSSASIWSPRSFLMTNASLYECKFPGSIEDWDQFADDRNPLNLTGADYGMAKPLPVERVAARFDFRDASENGDFIYKIMLNIKTLNEQMGADMEEEPSGASDKENLNLFSVQLSRMVLVNMSKDFYYLRRVSPDGTMTDPTYMGVERPEIKDVMKATYVVDTDYDLKSKTNDALSAGITPTNAPDHFNFPLYDERTTADEVYYNNMGGTYGWYINNIEDVLKGAPDNWESSIGGGVAAKGQYSIWRYVTENTIPSIDQQKTIQSTGIIFKARIIPGEDIDEDDNRYVSAATRNALMTLKNKKYTTVDMPKLRTFTDVSDNSEGEATTENLPALYSFQNFIYGGVQDIVEAAYKADYGSSLYYAVDNILNNWYVKKDANKVDGKLVFEYIEPKNQPKSDEIDNGDGTGGTYYQLNVTIAYEIMTGTQPTDESNDFSTGFDINFKDESDTVSSTLKDFNNSRFIELAPERNITVFIPTNDDTEGWGYYCYYFYWNRHNDNGYSGKMGPMEFATVRNNVYKLAVTGIKAIGHPRDTRRDPDPVKPNDPDEEPERSIVLEVNVLPWVVRVNNIEF